jgi:hypothetical protein
VANATKRVGKGTVRWTDEFTKRSSATLAAATTFYTGAHLGTTAAGYLAKFDDTAALTYAGTVRGKEGDPVLPIGTAGDDALGLDVQQPRRFELAITSVAVTDIGRRVYALDDQTGTLSASATLFANCYGTVVDVVGTSIALVEPPKYDGPIAPPIQSLAVSGAIPVRHGVTVLTKAGVGVMTLVDPTSGTHDGVEMTIISLHRPGPHGQQRRRLGFNAGGAATDVGTFGGAIGDGFQIVAYGGKWLVKVLRNVTLG